MAQPEVYGTLVDGGSIPFKIPGNTITRGNVTVLTPENFPEVLEDQFFLGRLLDFKYTIQNPIVIEFSRIRDLVRARGMVVFGRATDPADSQAADEGDFEYSRRVSLKNWNDLLKVLEEVYGPIEIKGRAEIDFWLLHGYGPKGSDG